MKQLQQHDAMDEETTGTGESGCLMLLYPRVTVNRQLAVPTGKKPASFRDYSSIGFFGSPDTPAATKKDKAVTISGDSWNMALINSYPLSIDPTYVCGRITTTRGYHNVVINRTAGKSHRSTPDKGAAYLCAEPVGRLQQTQVDTEIYPAQGSNGYFCFLNKTA